MNRCLDIYFQIICFKYFCIKEDIVYCFLNSFIIYVDLKVYKKCKYYWDIFKFQFGYIQLSDVLRFIKSKYKYLVDYVY